VKRFLKRPLQEPISEAQRLQEIDERHWISQQVFFRREERGWSQRDVAALTGISLGRVARIEAGVANPSLRTLVKLAHAFRCSISELSAPSNEGVAPAGRLAEGGGTRALASG
jgi:transcriptional regulator with XRE-family HTH domain